jgi:hypothetical protein
MRNLAAALEGHRQETVSRFSQRRDEVDHDPYSYRPIWLALIAWAGVLCLLSRALVWHEGVTIDDVASLLLGVLPFGTLVWLPKTQYFQSRAFAVSRLCFVAAWIATLAAFLVIRMNYWLEPFESLVCRTFPSDIARYVIISAVYSSVGFLISLLFTVVGRIRMSSRAISLILLVFFLNWTFFCISVFLIPAV